MAERDNIWPAVTAIAAMVAAVAAVLALFPRPETTPPGMIEPPPVSVGSTPGAAAPGVAEQTFPETPDHLSQIEVTDLRRGEEAFISIVFVGAQANLRGCRGDECYHLNQAFASIRDHEGAQNLSGVTVRVVADDAGVARYRVPARIVIGGTPFDTSTTNMRISMVVHDPYQSRFRSRTTNPAGRTEISESASAIVAGGQ